MSEIIVYTQNDCPPCTFVKNYLNEHQIDFEERNINNQQYRNEMIDFDAFSTPFIYLVLHLLWWEGKTSCFF
ncbi:glutaredoxin [Staphylococcus aureus]|nr:glutaredoxin [Staphylococcus aureus]